jgi:hypothetical protein
VQCDETQPSLANARYQTFDVFLRHHLIFLMTPPDHHIGAGERRFIEALRW